MIKSLFKLSIAQSKENNKIPVPFPIHAITQHRVQRVLFFVRYLFGDAANKVRAIDRITLLDLEAGNLSTVGSRNDHFHLHC